MPRILSQSGNVIAADFRKPDPSINISFKIDILYADPQVVLSRITYTCNGIVIGTQHVMAEVTH